MKKLILLFIVLFVFVGSSVTILSCDSDKKKQSQTTEKQAIKEEAKIDFSKGEAIYKAKCQVCHKADGKGTPNFFPPLANADYLLEDKMRAIKTSLYGTEHPIVVNGIKYNGKQMVIPGGVTPEESVEVVNYILNSWGNNGGVVTIEEVNRVIKKYRKK